MILPSDATAPQQPSGSASAPAGSSLDRDNDNLVLTLQSVFDGVVLTDQSGRVRLLNPAAESLTGWKSGEAQGKLVDEVVCMVDDTTQARISLPVEETIQTESAVSSTGHRLVRRSRRGEVFVTATCSALRGDRGQVRGALVLLRDVSRERRAEQMILTLNRELEERVKHGAEELRRRDLREAALLSNLRGMAYRCSLQGDWKMEFVTEGARNLLGVDPAALTSGWVCYGNLIHPSDRDNYAAEMQRCIAAYSAFDLEYRVKHHTDGWRWVWERGSIVLGESGEVKALEGFITDIQDRKEHELALREHEWRLECIFGALPSGVGFARNRVLVEVNARLCEMTGYTQSELLGHSTRVLYASVEDYRRVGHELYGQVCTSRIGTTQAVWKHKDGTEYHVSISATMLTPGDPSQGIAFTATDISDYKKLEERLRQMEVVVETQD